MATCGQLLFPPWRTESPPRMFFQHLGKLVSRYWLITDAHGRTEEVRGPGVVGEQPVLAPGDSFEYSSACPLKTPFGSMQGTYQMLTDSGEEFDAEIAPFQLVQPYSINPTAPESSSRPWTPIFSPV